MKKEKESITYDCSLCLNSIKQKGKLHCKNMIMDLNLPYTIYSEVKNKKDCGYFKEKK